MSIDNYNLEHKIRSCFDDLNTCNNEINLMEENFKLFNNKISEKPIFQDKTNLFEENQLLFDTCSSTKNRSNLPNYSVDMEDELRSQLNTGEINFKPSSNVQSDIMTIDDFYESKGNYEEEIPRNKVNNAELIEDSISLFNFNLNLDHIIKVFI